MFNVTGGEIVIILVLALIVLGPEKLPEAIRRFGQFYGEFKRMSTGFQTELRSALDEPMREIRETMDMAKGVFDEPVRELKNTADDINQTKQDAVDIFSGKKTSFTAPAPVPDAVIDPVLAAEQASMSIEDVGTDGEDGEDDYLSDDDGVFELDPDVEYGFDTDDEMSAADAVEGVPIDSSPTSAGEQLADESGAAPLSADESGAR